MNSHDSIDASSSDILYYQDCYSIFSNEDITVPAQSEQKKTSRGNRKMQRYRRKFRDQGMDSNTITEMISSTWTDMNASKANQATQDKEEANRSIASEASFHSTTAVLKKKEKKKKRKQTIVKKKKVESSEYPPTRKDKVPMVIKDSIDYTTVPNEIFLQMLSAAFTSSEKLDSLLSDDEKMQFIRHYTSLIDRRCYLHLQEFQWKYYHSIGMTQNIWNHRRPKHWAEKYSICYTYGRSKTLIQQRLNQIEQHLNKVHITIEQFEEEILSKCVEYDDCSSAMRELSSIIHQFVYIKQLPLQHEFEYKREMLILDATDHRLVQELFDLEPNKSQILSARRIWQATMKQMLIEEDITLLERRLTTTQSQSTSNLVHQMIDHIDHSLRQLNSTDEISLHGYLEFSIEVKRLQALKSDIIQKAILTSRGMKENLNATIQIEQNRFSLKNRYMESTAEWQTTVFDAIEIRRLHMIERTNFVIKHKLAI